MDENWYKYAVLTFIFNEYDLVRTPLDVSDDIEYVLVSDRYFEHPVWKVIVDDELAGKDPIYQSYYVRYHPFKYVHSDTCIVLDGSIKILSDVSSLVDSFNRSNRDMMIMCSNYLTIDQKIEHWRDVRDLDAESISNIKHLQDELGAHNLVGGIANAFKICRNNEQTRNFHLVVWGYLIECGIDGNPNRLDEVVEHMVLNAFFMHLRLSLVSTQLIHSNLLRHYRHRSCTEANMPSDYDDFFYLCSRPVTPRRFGTERTYPSRYRYRTEAILLTRYLDETDMDEWIDWHLNKCGFEHIQVFANDLPFDVENYSCKYDDTKVTFVKVPGIVRQYKIYNDYISNYSQAQWVMPVDDDEYVEISQEFDNIYDAVCYYEKKMQHLDMLAVRWRHMFPKKFHLERTGKVLDYCTEENKELAITFTKGGDRTVKTIVRRYGIVHYEESDENPAGGHVPKHSGTYAATLFDGTRVTATALNEYPSDTSDEKIRVMHCRYTGPVQWTRKYGSTDPSLNCKKISNSVPKDKHFLFNKLLPYLD